MPDSPDKDSQPQKPAEIDLSQLQGLSFGPDWSDTSPKVVGRKSPARRDSLGPAGSGQRRDRRPAKPRGERRNEGPDRTQARGNSRDRGRRDERRGMQQVFRPTVDVLFYPEDSPFKALSQAIRRHCKTYELFEIAKLILEKAERYVVVVKRKGKPSETKPFHIAIPDGAPFESEDEALNHVLKHHMEKFFTIEETEVEAPKGSFASVNKCGITGELLGPPNYHRYQALVQEHHTKQLPNMPFARYAAKIETIKDEEVIAEWVKKMTKVIRYTVKDASGDDVPSFDTLESAKNYLLAHCKERVVGVRDQARISGHLIDTLPDGPIKQSITTVLEMQRRFPLDTANNLRGRLRRMKFTIYKRGAKGVSFVCAVKRRFRDEKTVFAEDIHSLIDFIEKHPNISIKDLPKSYLGLNILDEHALHPPVEKAPDMAATEAPDETATIPTESTESKNALLKQEAIPPSVPTEKITGAAETESRTDYVSNDLPAEDRDKIRSMMMSLQWLVQEGYVTEFGDGTLIAPAPLAAPKPKGAVDDDAEEAQVKVTETIAKEDGNPAASEEQNILASEQPTGSDHQPEEPADNVAEPPGQAESDSKEPQEPQVTKSKLQNADDSTAAT